MAGLEAVRGEACSDSDLECCYEEGGCERLHGECVEEELNLRGRVQGAFYYLRCMAGLFPLWLPIVLWF